MAIDTQRPAGSFGQWLATMGAVLRNEQVADVPCDGCVGCCVSSYVIPLRPTDKVALDTVPARFLGLPADGRLARMNHRPDGTCPMLEANRCTIYAARPQTCRDYDCRIYAATGLLPDGNRPVIRDRVLEWRFGIDTAQEAMQSTALRRAASFIRDHAALFPPGSRPGSAAAVAVLAVKTWPLFAREQPGDENGEEPADLSPADLVNRVLEAVRAFDSP